MSKIIDELIKAGLGNVIENNIDKEILADEIYAQDMRDAEEIQARFDTLGFTKEQKAIIGDYIACIFSAHARACDIAYLVGAKDTVILLSELNAFKKE